MHKLINHIYIYLIPLTFSAIFSLKSFRLKWPKPFRIFSIFLWSTLVVEAFAIGWKWGLCKTGFWSYGPSNLWIYNAFVIIRQLFFLAFFYDIIPNERIKRLIQVFAIPFVVFSVLDYFFIQTPNLVDNYSIVFANALTIWLSVAFFYYVMRKDKLIQFQGVSEIWICIGAFLYYSVSLPFFMFFNWLLDHRSMGSVSLYLTINDALNITMYTFFLISFLCKPYFLMERR